MRKSNDTAKSTSIRISILLLAAAVLLSAVARLIPGFAQLYSSSVYPLLQGSIGRIAGLLPFSVSEALCCILPVLLAADIIVSSVTYKKHNASQHPVSRTGVIRPARRVLCHVLAAVCILIFLYAADCGVNYYRDPFVDRQMYESASFTDEDLDKFCEYTVERLQEIYSGDDVPYPDKSILEGKAIEAMKDLAAGRGMNSGAPSDTGALSGFYPRPKQLTVLSGLFSKMGVSGIYSPFTIEANINGEMMGLEKPFTACHELSHLKGFMNEGEANYIGWLACIGSEDKSFNRSGWLMAWIYAGNSLYRIDSDRYYELREKLPAEAVRELDENSEFWNSRETAASEVQDRVNDAYLKSNGQADGIRTYGRVTTLMLMWYASSGS